MSSNKTTETVSKENPFIKVEKEVVTTITEKPLTVEWKQKKIDYDLWCGIVQFFRDSYEKNKAEATLRLYYNRVTNVWAAWAYPQETQGMTVHELENHEDRAKQGEQFGSDWLTMGTMHHHCAAKAFQSGTDCADEKDNPGFHVTVGHIDKECVDIHCRFSYGGQIYDEIDLFDFIDTPEVDESVHEKYESMLQWAFIFEPIEGEYPKIWLDNVEKKQWGRYTAGNSKSTVTVTPVKKTEVVAKSDLDQSSEVLLDDEMDEIYEEAFDEIFRRQNSDDLSTQIAEAVAFSYAIEIEELKSWASKTQMLMQDDDYYEQLAEQHGYVFGFDD